MFKNNKNLNNTLATNNHVRCETWVILLKKQRKYLQKTRRPRKKKKHKNLAIVVS